MISLLIIISLSILPATAQESCPSNPDSDFIENMRKAAFELYLEASMNSVGCHRLDVGKSKNIQFAASVSPSRVTHAYRLTRTGAKTYKSEIKLNLRPEEGETISDEEISQLKNKIGECLKELSPLLKGPDGESLEIVLSDEPGVPETNIRVTKENQRGHAWLYRLDFHCRTILHEILHLHGLVDEYLEMSFSGAKQNPQTGKIQYVQDGSSPHYDCRHTGLLHSVMSNYDEAYMAAIASFEVWNVNTCVKDESNPPRVPECPEGYRLKTKRYYVPAGEPPSRELIEKNGAILIGSPKLIKRVEKVGSLLLPAHFRAITRPGCKEENKLYYMCATNAYISSAAGYGIQIDEKSFSIKLTPDFHRQGNSACQPTPEICKDPERWLR